MSEVTTCPNCGAARAGDARFCAGCGRDFSAPAEQATVPQAPAPQAPAPPSPGQHTITVKTEGFMQAMMKMFGVSMGCGCAILVFGVILFILLIWILL
jgi:uncharacterized membrane protein YvbJ